MAAPHHDEEVYPLPRLTDEAYRPQSCVVVGGPWLEEPKGRSANAGVAASPARTRPRARSFFTGLLHSRSRSSWSAVLTEAQALARPRQPVIKVQGLDETLVAIGMPAALPARARNRYSRILQSITCARLPSDANAYERSTSLCRCAAGAGRRRGSSRMLSFLRWWRPSGMHRWRTHIAAHASSASTSGASPAAISQLQLSARPPAIAVMAMTTNVRRPPR